MKTYRTIKFSTSEPSVVVLGCFDGVHSAHSRIILEARNKANELGLQCIAWGFSAPPRNYFLENSVKVLTTPDEKRIFMARTGVDIYVNIPFGKRISNMSAEKFFTEILIGQLNAKCIVCGYNYSFGNGGSGNIFTLSELCREHRIELIVLPVLKLEDIKISSSAVRDALINGDLKKANALLGRPYSLRAEVIGGQKLGRQLGFPTVNQVFSKDKLLPKSGVYFSRISGVNIHKYGITNIGIRPTVGGTELCAETNIFNYNGSLYGQTLTIELLEFIRPENKFSTIEELKEQIAKDTEKAWGWAEEIRIEALRDKIRQKYFAANPQQDISK